MDKRIVEFISKHHLLSLASMGDGRVDICSLFYAYDKRDNFFVVASDTKTQHVQNILKNPQVAVSIALESNMIGKLQGVQIDARIFTCKDSSLYLKRFPYAVAFELTLWKIVPVKIKFTDNKLGFGKKLHWEEE